MHYDYNTLAAAAMRGAPRDGDTCTDAAGEHWTCIRNGLALKWVKTSSLSPQPVPAIPPGPPPMSPPRGYEGVQFGGTPYSPVAKAETNEKLPPMTCSEGCGFTNEYVGKEHLINGIYVCRECRPGYERRQRTLALKEKNEASASDPYAYGPSWKDGIFRL